MACSAAEAEIGPQSGQPGPKAGEYPDAIHDAHGLRTVCEVEGDDERREEAREDEEAGDDG
jgi:hypothetical protein